MNHEHQPSMFGESDLTETPDPKTLARRADPNTSKKAAQQTGQFIGDHYAVILQAMAQLAKPAGAEQMSATLLRGGVKLDPYQIRKRLPELEARGSVRVHMDGGVAAERSTSSGRSERLWELVS